MSGDRLWSPEQFRVGTVSHEHLNLPSDPRTSKIGFVRWHGAMYALIISAVNDSDVSSPMINRHLTTIEVRYRK